MEYYMVYIIIGLGLGAAASSIITKGSIRVQNAKDTLEAKKAWVKLISDQNKNKV
jgi:Na+-driven multidrug efflux pump